MSEIVEIVAKKEILGRSFAFYGTVEEPLFLAKDVAELLEHSNARAMIQTVDDDEKVVRNVYTLGGNQDCVFLTEDGLYEVLMQSRKPIAKSFKKQVKDILKTLRKTGGYISNADKRSELGVEWWFDSTCGRWLLRIK